MSSKQSSPALTKPLQRNWKEYQKSLSKAGNNPSRQRVHEFRDSVHRLNAVLEMSYVLHPSKATLNLVEDLKGVRKKFGKLRDTQVELHLLEDYRKEKFYQFLKKRRKKAQKKALKGVKNLKLKPQRKRLDRLQKTFKKQKLSEKDWSALEKSLRTQEMQLKEDLPKISQLSEKRIHELRMLSKKLLFQAQILRDLFQKKIPSLEKYQEVHDVLGEVQNEIVLLRVLEKYLHRKKSSKDQLAADLSVDLNVDRQRKLEEAHQNWSQKPWQH